ncbi:MAG: phosphotransferase enzyme family protein [Pirellulales bacterium]
MSEIAKILRDYPADCQPTVVESLGSAGGLSGAEFWRLVAPRGALGLRRWPIEHPTPERLALIHAVLRHAAGRGIDFVPVPIGTTLGDTFVREEGQLWELAPWLPGAADYEEAPSVEKLRAAMISLARFHLAVADFPVTTRLAPAPAITQRLKRLRELQSGGISTLVAAIDESTWPQLAPLVRGLTAALPRAVPSAIAQLAPLADTPLPLQFCIRDVWCDNFLFIGNTVTGLVDFGAVDVDTRATDVARLLGSLAGDSATQFHDGLAAYSSVCELSDQELRAVHAIDVGGTTLAACNWLRWIYLDRRTFERSEQVQRRLCRIMTRMDAIGLR